MATLLSPKRSFCGWVALLLFSLACQPAQGQERPHLRDYAGKVHLQAFAPDGATLVTVRRSVPKEPKAGLVHGPLEVKRWNTATWRERSACMIALGEARVLALAPDGRTLATAGPLAGKQSLDVRLWDTHGGKLRAVLKEDGTVTALSFSPDGKVLAAALGGGLISLWDLTKQEVAAVCTGHYLTVLSLAFSPDGKTLAAASGNKDILCGNDFDRLPRGEIKLWNAATGKLRTDLQDPGKNILTAGGLHQLTFARDGRTVAALTATTVVFWEVPTGRLRAAFTPPESPTSSEVIESLTFAPDGRTAAVVWLRGRDLERNEVELWHLPTGRVMATLRGHAAPVEALAFSPDGRFLATAGDGVQVWDLSAAPRRVVGRGGAPR